MKYKTITFYKYVELKNPEQFREYLRGLCEGLNLFGRILIAEEGINAGVSGSVEEIEKFKQIIKTKRKFSDLTFRENASDKNSYHKLVVRVRPEIIAFGKKVNLRKKGKYLSPERFKKWLDREEDLVILDARNDYETKIGKFKNALILPIENFNEFTEAAEKILVDKKDKKIIMYCTGGIRCEKSSAYLKEKGFKNVFQLKGGIINYVNEFPNTHFKGSCFVFDDRLSKNTGSDEVLSCCEICGASSDKYLDCHNMDCDKLFVCCEDCQKKMNKTCSEVCKNSGRHRDTNPRLTINN